MIHMASYQTKRSQVTGYLFQRFSTFFVLDMLSKPTFRLKIGQKYKNFSELLESQRVVPNAKSCS